MRPARDGPSALMFTRTIAATDRGTAEGVWLRLEGQTGSLAMACSWAWTQTWLAHYGDVVPHRFVVGVEGGEDVGIALVTRGADTYPPVVGARQAYIGTAGEPRGQGVFVERNRLLVADEQRDAFAAALLEHLAHDAWWDRLLMPGLHPVDADCFERANAGVVLDSRGSPVTDLTLADGGDPLKLLASRPRRRARRALEGLAPLTTEWAQTREQGHAILDELIELHQLRWTAAGEAGAFSNSRFVGFHRALIDRLEPGRGVILVRVHREGETIGCIYGQVEDRDVLFYQGGMRRLDDNKLNVGLAVHVCAMRACVAHGMRAYDFLAPSMRYKLELSTSEGSLVWATLERNRVRTQLDRSLRRLRTHQQERRARAEEQRSSPTAPAPSAAPV